MRKLNNCIIIGTEKTYNLLNLCFNLKDVNYCVYWIVFKYNIENLTIFHIYCFLEKQVSGSILQVAGDRHAFDWLSILSGLNSSNPWVKQGAGGQIQFS